MAQPTLQKITIDGTDVSDYLQTWKIRREFGNKISQGRIVFNNNINLIISFDSDNTYHTVTIQRGVSVATEDTVFKGEVYSFQKTGSAVICQIRDELYKSVRAEITKSYDKNIDTEAGVISEIVKDILDDCDLNYTSSTIDDSGTDNIVSKFICNHADAFERLTKLAKLIDWQLYYNPSDDYVYFEELGTNASTTTLTVGSNITEQPTWSYDKTQMCNKYTIIGGEEEVETEETFDGDGSTTTFTLTYTPVNVRVEVGGTLQTGGNDTTTTSFDYSVGTEEKQIIFESGSIPGAVSDNVKVIYTHMLPRPVLTRNAESINTHGEFKKTSFESELKDVDDVQGFAQKYVGNYGEPFLSTKLKVVDVNDIWPGQTITVVDGTVNINQDFLVTKVELTYPYRGDIVFVGDEVLRKQNWGINSAIRIRRLEEAMGKNQDKLTHVLDYYHTIKYKRRYTKLQKTIIDLNNSFILSHPEAGILGTSKLGKSVATAATDVKISQGDNKYREFVYDEDFNDLGNTTADFDTTNRWIDFNSGEIWTSDKIDLGTTWKWATINLGTTSGTITAEITFDNKSNWQTFTEGTRTLIGNSDGTGTYVRLTEGAATIARVENTTDVYGQYTAPAIEIIMEE